jgi:hypothetical protein
VLRRSLRIFVASGLALAMPLAVPSVADARARHVELLEALWTTVFELPVDENPFAGADPCLVLTDPNSGRPVLAPFAPSASTTECSATRGTTLFVTGWSSECSDIEPAPFFGADEAARRACARAADAGLEVPVVTFDGRRVQMHEVETGAMTAELPEDDVFGVDVDAIHSVAHGWVALLPLTPGTHEVSIQNAGTYPAPPGPSAGPITTIIEVTR